MGKINLSTTALNHQCKKSYALSTDRLSLKKVLLFLNTLALLYFLPATFIQAQYYNQTPEFLKANSHWAFGTRTGIEFSTGTARSFTTAMTGNEGFATVSSRTTGDLLFYTNGGSVWNANHNIMPNGTGLMGNPTQFSTLQGSLIVPFINDTNKYYLFSLASNGRIRSDAATGKRGSLFYSIVDMTLDNGNGDIETVNKNIVLDTDSLSEGMIAIPGCNNDIWVITHSFTQSPQRYIAYHITENGVNHTPVISPSKVNGNNLGSMAVSSDRKKIVLATSLNNIELSYFDPTSGTISGSILLAPEVSGYGYRSAIFSPDNSILYISHVTYVGRILQYDISVFDSAAIDASKQPIGDLLFSGFRLYNDTIYSADYNYSTFQPQIVHRINQPNNRGLACDFQLNAIILNGRNTEATLGSDVVFPISYDTVFTALDTIMCVGWENGVFLTANDTTISGGYTWSTGDTTTTIRIDGQGVYWVKYGECNQHYIDTFRISGSGLFTIITVNGFELGTTGGPFVSYQWYFNDELIPGATDSTYTVTENGSYTVEITDEYGCVFRSDVYEVTNVDTRVREQLAKAVRIYPNPADEKINIYAPVPVQVVLTGIDGKELIKGNSTVNIGHLAQGLYFLTVTDMEGQVFKIEKIVKE